MGTDISASDFLNAINDLLLVAGALKIVRVITRTTIDPNNPGLAPVETPQDISIPVTFTEFNEAYIPGANTLEGTSMAILSVKSLTDIQKASIVSGSYLIDGSKLYTIVNTNPTFFNGTIITIFIQLRG